MGLWVCHGRFWTGDVNINFTFNKVQSISVSCEQTFYKDIHKVVVVYMLSYVFTFHHTTDRHINILV